jgi:fructokinase
MPSKIRALHVGSYAMAVEPIAATLRALVERLQPSTLIAWDPNVRLSVEPNADCWRSQLEWMLSRTHLLKLSDEDLAVLAPGDASEAFAKRALSCGVKLVVVTHRRARRRTREVSRRRGQRWCRGRFSGSAADVARRERPAHSGRHRVYR